MKLKDASVTEITAWLRRDGLGLRAGPFWFKIHSNTGYFTAPFSALYRDYEIDPACALPDFHVSVQRALWFRHVLRPQIQFRHDGDRDFHPMSGPEAAVMFEWGLNWCISTHAHHYLILHAAVVARGDDALLLSAVSGSGKSTLTAALIHHGWRLLSDELALVDLTSGLVWGLGRPVNLKGTSIDVIQELVPAAEMVGRARSRYKGDVALMRAPTAAIAEIDRPAKVRWIIQPTYTGRTQAKFLTVSGAQMLLSLADNCFNYEVLGETGFNTLGRLVANAGRYQYFYGDAGDAVEDFAQLADFGLEQAA